jgi:YesN/AraC family two-component response regulator
MDGVTCARKILEKDPGSKIVLISGYNEVGPNGIDEETRSLITGYITKPIDVMELSALLKKILNPGRIL